MKSLYHRITRPVTQFVSTWHVYIASGLLVMMFGLGLTSMSGNSAIVDEVAHIPAAYSYLHYGDFRLNPEHPPLVKDLAAIPLQFMHLKFPETDTAWTSQVNGQWDTGWSFLYHIGNDADQILFWSRLPILLLALGFGVLLYWYSRRHWGTAVGLLTLFFYALSPNILAHAGFVTTDLGATAFMFLALITFVRFVRNPSGRNLFWLSLALTAAQLAKFSSVLLYPLLGVMAIAMVWASGKPKGLKERLGLYVGGFISASGLSVVWIWLYYIPHTWNMPEAVQDRLITGSLYGDNFQGLNHFLMSINNWDILKPLAHYILGLAMVFNRVSGGNVTYFNGQVSNQSFQAYFPELFAVKTQVALLILMVLMLGLAVYQVLRRRRPKLLEEWRAHVAHNFLEWTLGAFAVFYFWVSVNGNLNLGIRHILPIYVPIFVLVAVATVRRMRRLDPKRWQVPAAAGLAVLMLWYGGSTVINHPHYVSYFNEIIGGPKQADKYFSDSNVDWGQDLRRLKTYIEDHPEINHIAVDYFGGGVPAYYFCLRKLDERGRLITTYDGYDCSNSVMEEWHSQNGKYTGQYIAVSETFLENDRYYAVINQNEGYEYLRQMTPVAKVGNSIHIYKMY